jgi:antibiotic biosynthesis monooxygenase (ABM) superfamily enzyme
VNRPQNEFIWVRTFDTEETLKKYETSAERAAYTGETGPHIAKTEVRTVENALS